MQITVRARAMTTTGWGGPPPGASKHQEIDSGDLCDRSLLGGFEPGNANLNLLFDANAFKGADRGLKLVF